MENAVQQKTLKAFDICLLVNCVATLTLCLILLIYCLAAGLPLSALTIFPIALLMIAFSYFGWKLKGAIWILGQLIPGAIVWYYIPMKWLFLIDTIIGMAVFVFGIVLFCKKPKEQKTAYIKEQLSGAKKTLVIGIPAIVISLTVIISAFCVPTDSFYVGNTIGKYKAEVEQAGQVVKHEYDSFVYDDNGAKTAENKKYCYVYLPYGYDETKQYNVLYLMHGAGGSAGSWILESEGSTTKNMLDAMIAKKEIEPLIVVSMSLYYQNDIKNGGSTKNFKYELKNDLMPSVEGIYSTYANKVTTVQSFRDSRDHRGFGGYSMGSKTTYQSALIGALDYFSYFAPMHGGFVSSDEVLYALTEGEYKDYQINYILCCDGTLDNTYPDHLALYKKLIDSGKVREGINGDMLTLLFRKHNIDAWQTDLYNALIRFF